MTKQQADACKLAYRRHRASCLAIPISPQPFGLFAYEWLECHRGEEMFPTEASTAATDVASSPGASRDYNRMFDGKGGFE